MKLAKTSCLQRGDFILYQHRDPIHNTVFSHCHDLVFLLKSCKRTSEISQIHGFMVKTSLDHDPFTLSKLLAYSIQDIQYAASIFNHIQYPNLFMFNTILRAHSISDYPRQAFGVFNNLRAQGIKLDQFSFITTLKACTHELAIKTGQGIHGVANRSGHLTFINVKNVLMHLYGNCGRIGDARKLFDEFPLQNDVVSWNTLMGGYLQVFQPAMTIELFRQMLRPGLSISATTLLHVLSAFVDLGDPIGRESIHVRCTKMGFCSNLNVVTALIEMYATAGDINSGRRIFDGVVQKDVVLWNCMIDKYANVGLLEEAVTLLQLMKLEQVKPNSSTLAGLLSTCAASGSIKLGRCLNDYAQEEGLELDAVLGTALVDMFAKCGFLGEAIDVFERIERKDVKCWTSMILGYGDHGRARQAVALLSRMEEEGFIPNEVTFLVILSACSHGGLVSEAMKCFGRMIELYGLSPKEGHYGCMIDLLGRAGLLEEAHDLIKSLPVRGDTTAWRALLAACRHYGNVELGECVKRILAEMGDEHPTNAILLSSTYAIAGRLPEVAETGNRLFGKRERIVKEAGCSTIVIDAH